MLHLERKNYPESTSGKSRCRVLDLDKRPESQRVLPWGRRTSLRAAECLAKLELEDNS